MSDTLTQPVVTVTPGPVVQADAAAPKRSVALQSIANKRKLLKKNLFIDLQVPRWNDPEIFVRYRPVESTVTEAAIEKRRESQDAVPEWLLLANADILVLACDGVYACLDGDHTVKYSLRAGDPEGSWTKFDPDLGAALEVPIPTANDVVRALYLTDGDLIAAANRVVEWSSLKGAEVNTNF